MFWTPKFLAAALLFAAAGFASQVESASAQGLAPVCGRNANVPTVELGAPDASGVTRQETLDDPASERAYRFLIADPSAAFVYVGDQWYDLDLAVYSIELDKSVACWTTTGAKARSDRTERRVLQLIRPDEQIIEGLKPGVYVLLVGADQQYALNPGSLAGFDSSKPFTIRVATSPLVCGLQPPNVPHPRAAEDPAYAGVKVRANDALYQVAMSYQPLLPTANSLMTFGVTASPPYNDLFDFQWALNGRPIPGATDTVLQIPAAQIASAGGTGQISVTAKGARVYPDPDQPSIPLDGGSLTVTCPVLVQ